MIRVEPTGAVLGAAILDVDLSKPMRDDDFRIILRALGDHGVLRFPNQDLNPGDVSRFSGLFGEIQGNPIGKADAKREFPEVGILSNLKENGQYIGSPDAGQDWHTDMTYRDVTGFVNVLYGVRIPMRDGKPLGGTEFSNMHMVYDALPADIKTRLDGAIGIHDFTKFWDHMRNDRGSQRPALTEEQRRMRPPVPHPIFLTHPITGRKVLYCNPGFTDRIEGMPRPESDELLAYLFEFQLRDQFRYTNHWTEKDLLMWDNLGTIHRAIADYGPDEIRLIRRCQVMATKIFDPGFARLAQAA
ncbi:MAG: TauD/TfdA family dioxygenase [Acetobacteraceae bacterium]|nr:TauD/TfdA family dioxygenase [Acetobacteraceae bacterium]